MLAFISLATVAALSGSSGSSWIAITDRPLSDERAYALERESESGAGFASSLTKGFDIVMLDGGYTILISKSLLSESPAQVRKQLYESLCNEVVASKGALDIAKLPPSISASVRGLIATSNEEPLTGLSSNEHVKIGIGSSTHVRLGDGQRSCRIDLPSRIAAGGMATNETDANRNSRSQNLPARAGLSDVTLLPPRFTVAVGGFVSTQRTERLVVQRALAKWCNLLDQADEEASVAKKSLLAKLLPPDSALDGFSGPFSNLPEGAKAAVLGAIGRNWGSQHGFGSDSEAIDFVKSGRVTSIQTTITICVSVNFKGSPYRYEFNLP